MKLYNSLNKTIYEETGVAVTLYACVHEETGVTVTLYACVHGFMLRHITGYPV